ncbi:MAG: CBS domain-containing protein [bacterium]
MKNKFIKNILASDVICVPPETILSDVVLIMRKKNISCVVVTENKKPVGIFTERDMVKYLCRNTDHGKIKIEKLMSKSLVTVKKDINIYELYDLLINNNIRHLVVIDEDDNTVGIITQTDIISNLGLEYFFDIKDISKIMTKNLTTVPENSLLPDIISKMADHSFSCIIVERDKKPIGIFTERDVVDLYNRGVDLKTLTVDKVMSSPVITVNAKIPLYRAVKMMNHNRIRRLVVVDDKGIITGLITQYDIVKGLEAKYIEFLKDIISQKEKMLEETENDLIEKTAYLENILSSSTNMAIIASHLDFQILYCNPAAENIFGYNVEKLSKTDLKKILEKENLEEIRFNRAMALIQDKGDYDFMIEQQKKDGTCFIESRLSGIWDKRNRLIGYVLISRDITERKRAEQRLEHMAHFDLLTDIPNRVLFFDRLNHAINEANREKIMVGLLFIDLDGFKSINDRMGHLIGDLVLKTSAEKLKKCVRKSDTVARISGDEFAIVLSKIKGKKDAEFVARKIIRNFSKPFSINGHKMSIGVSIGISMQHYNGKGSEKKLLNDADTAMYYVKEQGKNNYKFFGE